jgi:hypothetical protein
MFSLPDGASLAVLSNLRELLENVPKVISDKTANDEVFSDVMKEVSLTN